MNEERRKLVCGEVENICGTQCTSESTENGGKIKEKKTQDLNGSATENGFSASVEKIESSKEEVMAAIDNQEETEVESGEEGNKAKEEDDEEERRKEEEEVQQSLKEAQEQVEQKLSMREKNLAALGQPPEESYFKGRDSSVKKNSAFIKKLRTITESQRESLEQEFAGLNLSRYVQEAVAALLDGLAKLKLADVKCVVHICNLIHQHYGDFNEPLKKGLVKMFQETYGGKEEDKLANVSKYRVSLRLLGELVIAGVLPKLPEGIKILNAILSNILNCDKESHTYVQVIISFARHCGEDFAGFTSRKQRQMAEKHKVVFPKCCIVPAEDQAAFYQILHTYYKSLAGHLLKAHKDLQNREKQNRQTLMTKGELHPDRKEAFEKAQKSYEKLLANTASLADILDLDMPELPQYELVQQEAGANSIDVFNPFRHSEYDGSSGLWEDEETRIFYENLRDLKAFLPGILYKDEGKEEAEVGSYTVDDEKPGLKELEIAEEDYEEMDDYFGDEEFNEKESEEEDDDNSSGETPGSSTALALEAILQRLPTCVNKDFIDEVATEFMQTCNTKGNRKKLCRALFGVPRTRLDLLPMYARLVATLDPCAPDLAPELMQQLKGEFRFRVRKKDQINVESKIKAVRFIGELTKFHMFPKGETLHCLKLLLEDFTHHNVEMACNLLEVCGRFLYRSPDSHIRTKHLLELMMRKKAVQNLDSRQLTLIENAFFYCNPPERQKVAQKERPPMHEYIRKLLYKDLSKTTTEKVLRQIRKLPWDDPQVALYVIKCLIRVWNMKYNSVHCAANLLAGVVQYHEDVGLYVVDGILEDIRLGMETNLQKMNQRRVSCVKFLGELYNYRQVESRVIFSTLYSFITFGNNQEGIPSALDPPGHLFRIRLMCTLLDTCGQYFDHGNYKKKLDCFLVYFQCYVLKKKADPIWHEGHPYPRDVDYMVADTLESLRPKLTMFTNLEEAIESLETLNKEHQEQIEKAAPLNQDTNTGTQPLPIPNTSYSKVVCSSPAASLGNSPCHSPMLREEDELSETGESEGDDEDEGPGPHGMESDIEVTEVDMNDMDMNKVKVLSPPKPEPTVEDRAFLAAFDKLMLDDIQNRREENPKVPSLDVAVPMHLKGQRARHNSLTEENESLNFVVMLKKGNKQHFKDLQIPLSSGLAANIRDRQMAEQQEQEEVKRLVLNYNQRQEEEIYNEMLAHQRQSGSDQASRSHHRFNKRRVQESNVTNLAFANLTRKR